MAFAAVQTAFNLKAKCIVTPTMSGQTARLVSNFRPSVPIYAVTPNERAQRKLQIDWGVVPLQGVPGGFHREYHFPMPCMWLKREKLVKPGDMVVFTAGDPTTNMVKGKGNMTNMMHVIETK